MIDLLILFSGFIPLIYGANILVDSSSSLAKKLNIPSIVIGLTIVSFGTSSPELIVNIFASASGNSDIALGNIIGSNIFNILGILGISAMIYPLSVKTNTTWIEIPLCLLSAVGLLLLSCDKILQNSDSPAISGSDGIILLVLFAVFLAYNMRSMRKGKFEEKLEIKDYRISTSVFMIITGIILLTLGGRLIVIYAVRLAASAGIPERIIALTIVSLGTSLPELATSAVAAKKRNVDIAIGNVVGSNIFNVFFILGISSCISPISVLPVNNLDMLVNILASIMLFIFIFTGRGRMVERWEGAVLIVLYLLYLSALLISG